MSKIKIAAVKFSGCCSGGSEKWLQTVAANLPKKKFDIDYYYCDAAPYLGSTWTHPDTDSSRVEYLRSKKVNLIKFNVGAKNVTIPTHDWIDTNFWDLFKEENYDIIITCRAGHSEYPFYLIKNKPIVEFITLPGMSDRQDNIKKSIHISNFQANSWCQVGGNPSKIEVIPLFSELPKRSKENLRRELSLKNGQFVFGLHQRVDPGIYSGVPLEAYSKIENDNTAFVLMGGGIQYREQAAALGLKNFYPVEASGDYDRIGKFLATLDVYSHGRKDGETFGLSISEAMFYSLPIISHVAPAMGHAETISSGGIVVNSIEEYSNEMLKLMNDTEYRKMRGENSKNRFENVLSLEKNIEKVVNIFEELYKQEKMKDNIEKLPVNDYWETLWS